MVYLEYGEYADLLEKMHKLQKENEELKAKVEENRYREGDVAYLRSVNTALRAKSRKLEQENNRLNKYIQQLFRVMLKEVKEKV